MHQMDKRTVPIEKILFISWRSIISEIDNKAKVNIIIGTKSTINLSSE